MNRTRRIAETKWMLYSQDNRLPNPQRTGKWSGGITGGGGGVWLTQAAHQPHAVLWWRTVSKTTVMTSMGLIVCTITM